jgi:hypothetical protein
LLIVQLLTMVATVAGNTKLSTTTRPTLLKQRPPTHTGPSPPPASTLQHQPPVSRLLATLTSALTTSLK